MRETVKLGRGPRWSLVGNSAWVRNLREQIRIAAEYGSSVLITGPTGTGKELIARSLHCLSNRADQPFIPLNCAAVSGPLFASHVFGHVRGAFTGALYHAIGCFRAAEGGSIFLDEVSELEIDMQAKLLRVLQERTVVPVGGQDEIPINVRVIAATNRDLLKDIEIGRFRNDLYYRLNVVTLETIPLCERPEDIEPLAHHLLERFALDGSLPRKGLSDQGLRVLCHYDWPGNVRELENVLERAVMFARGDDISSAELSYLLKSEPAVEDLSAVCVTDEVDDPLLSIHLPPAEPLPILTGCLPRADGSWVTIEELEREHIRLTLEYVHYNQTAAASLLCISRGALRHKIKKFGISDIPVPRGRPAVLHRLGS